MILFTGIRSLSANHMTVNIGAEKQHGDQFDKAFRGTITGN